MPRILTAVVLGAALMVPMAITPNSLQAQETRKYHDKKRNEDHEWNDREDQAYKIYGTQKHRHLAEFSTLNENDQQSYWNWRHQHSDALLKIDIK